MIDFFGLKSLPFLKTIHTEQLMLVNSQEKALHSLLQVLNSKEIGLLTGEVGTGKSKVLEKFMKIIPNSQYKLLYLAEPQGSPRNIWRHLLGQFGIFQSGWDGFRLLHKQLQIFQKEARREPILIVDEAHELRMETIKELRFLTNVTPEGLCPLILILCGQPELTEKLKNPCYEGFNQRVGSRYRLLPLEEEECLTYIEHHLQMAGAKDPIFDVGAKQLIFSYTRGIPRRVNQACLNAMHQAYEKKEKTIKQDLVNMALEEMMDQ